MSEGILAASTHSSRRRVLEGRHSTTLGEPRATCFLRMAAALVEDDSDIEAKREGLGSHHMVLEEENCQDKAALPNLTEMVYNQGVRVRASSVLESINIKNIVSDQLII